MRPLLLLAACAAVLGGCADMRTALGEREVLQLEQLPWADAYSQWTPAQPADRCGLPRINTSVAGTPLKVNGLPFERGFSVGGNATILYTLGGRAASLKLLAGVDDASSLPSGMAVVEIRGDGRPLVCETITARRAPVTIDLRVVGINDLLIRIAAPTGVFTDIIMPELGGMAGLRLACAAGRQRVAGMATELPDTAPTRPVMLADGALLFSCDYPGYGACLGMSNGTMCVIIAPQCGGRVVHIGRTAGDNMLGTQGVSVAPHPADRRVAPLRAAYAGAWKWKVEDDGTLRLLSPADAPHGIRWSRTFRLERAAPVLHTAVLVKNISGHDVSWSAGTEFVFAPGAQVQLPGDCTTVGMITARKGETTLLITTAGARHGLYPHNGLRVQRTEDCYVLYDELTPLSPGEDSVQQQQWKLEQGAVVRSRSGE